MDKRKNIFKKNFSALKISKMAKIEPIKNF